MTAVIITPTDRDFTDTTIRSPDGTTSTITSTQHHRFYDVTRHAWIDAADLHRGDLLREPDGTWVTVVSVRNYHTHTTTYNLTVQTLHTYYTLAGNTPILVHNCGPALGSGRAYSIAYETEIPSNLYPGRSRGAHFQAANRSLLEAMDNDSEFDQAMNVLIPGIRKSLVGPRGGISRGAPSPLWTWHHAADEGVMQLVPRIQHEAPGNLQKLFHPGGVGGFSIWG